MPSGIEFRNDDEMLVNNDTLPTISVLPPRNEQKQISSSQDPFCPKGLEQYMYWRYTISTKKYILSTSYAM